MVLYHFGKIFSRKTDEPFVNFLLTPPISKVEFTQISICIKATSHINSGKIAHWVLAHIRVILSTV